MQRSYFVGTLVTVLILAAAAASAVPLPPTAGRTDLVLGKKVLMAPPPSDGFSGAGASNASDLTDGKTVADPHKPLWWDKSSVWWQYAGRIDLAVDLGKQCDINEIAMRFQNMGWSPGVCFPGWVQVFVSSDGEHYEKVGEFSRWHRGNDFKKFGIEQTPDLKKLRWVDVLRFKDLKARGRWVALRIYGGGMLASDELYVFGAPANGELPAAGPTKVSDFTITHPYVYFHKPYLEVATNVQLPVPTGLILPPGTQGEQTISLSLDLPPGLELGSLKAQDVHNKAMAFEGPVTVTIDGQNWRRYQLKTTESKSLQQFARLFLQAAGWKDGQKGELRYQFGDGHWQSPVVRLPVRAVNVPQAPRLKKIMSSLGWWDAPAMIWPNQLQAYRIIGVNTVSLFAYWRLQGNEAATTLAFLQKARDEGFFIANVDSPFSWIISRHAGEKGINEVYDQFADGTVGKHLCISYRGRFYQQEIQRFAKMMAMVKPDFSSEDIELWSGGPSDSRKCTRCQADFAKSGLKSWDEWQQAKGKQMIHDLITSARRAVKEAGGKPFSTGVYDFRPGEVYQKIFNFDQLYPELLNTSQVSTYTSLQPSDLEYIGDKARLDRSRLPRSDEMPWNTPGDAGTFPGEAFQWSLLENYCNGARGMWFWSSRMWDSEDLIAFNRVVRAIAPVEDLIVHGELVGTDAAVVGKGRVSGIKYNHEMMLLVADYFGRTGGKLKLKLKLAARSMMRDLMSGQTVVADMPAGQQALDISLDGQPARLLEIIAK